MLGSADFDDFNLIKSLISDGIEKCGELLLSDKLVDESSTSLSDQKQFTTFFDTIRN